jgi:predicted phage terminase large subunit-like protein
VTEQRVFLPTSKFEGIPENVVERELDDLLREISTLEAARRVRRERHLLEASLPDFVRAAWPHVVPGVEIVWEPHMDAICTHIVAVVEGKIRNLLINVPPGTSKSLIVNVFWPAWTWTTKPEKRFLHAANEESLVVRDSLTCRRLIESDWYKSRWGHVFRLTSDQNVKTLYENSAGGFRSCATAGSNVTGKKGDYLICFPYNTPVQTSTGEVMIGDIVERRLPVKVATYNHGIGAVEYRPVTARMRNACHAGMVTVTFSDGRSLSCTDDHPIFVRGEGYRPARLLRHGDEVVDYQKELHLRPLRQAGVQEILLYGMPRQVQDRGRYAAVPGLSQAVLPRPRTPQTRPVLQPRLCGQEQERREESSVAGRHGCQELPGMSQAISGEDEREFEGGQVQPLMSRQAHQQTPTSRPIRQLSDVQENHQNHQEEGRQEELLQPRLRRRGARLPDGRSEERTVRSRQLSKRLPEGVGRDRPVHNQGEGRLSVPPVRHDARGAREDSSRPPYQLQQGRHQGWKSCDGLPVLPRQDARWGGVSPGVAGEVRLTVVAVEECDSHEFVYNIAVEPHNNYFASGVLVHNCDDLHDAKKAMSEAERRKVKNWFFHAFASRLNDYKKGARLVIGQRVHADDIAEELIAQGWELLCLPEEFVSERKCRTSIGFEDWRTKDGELLRPLRFGHAEIEQARKFLLKHGYETQHQQNATTSAGSLFEEEWFQGPDRIIPITKLPENCSFLRYWDKAGTEGGGAYTCGVLMARSRDNRFFVVDVIRKQINIHDRELMIVDTAKTDNDRWGRTHIVIEQEPGSAGKESCQATIGRLAGFIAKADKVTGSKIDRAKPFASMCGSGNVYLVMAQWNRAWLNEILSFPEGKYKDQVDASAGAFAHIGQRIPQGTWKLERW